MDEKERLGEAINYIKLMEPGIKNVDISKRLKYRSDSYITELISGTKKINDIFLTRLREEFDINPEYIKSGSGQVTVLFDDIRNALTSKNRDYHDKYIATIEDRLKQIEDDKKFLQRIIESNLSLLVNGQQTLQAQLATIHQWDALKDAEGKAGNGEELQPLINKAAETIQRIFVANLQQANKGGSTAVSQSSQEEGKSQPPLRGQMANLLGKGGMGSTVKNRSKKNSVSEKDK